MKRNSILWPKTEPQKCSIVDKGKRIQEFSAAKGHSIVRFFFTTASQPQPSKQDWERSTNWRLFLFSKKSKGGGGSCGSSKSKRGRGGVAVVTWMEWGEIAILRERGGFNPPKMNRKMEKKKRTINNDNKEKYKQFFLKISMKKEETKTFIKLYFLYNMRMSWTKLGPLLIFVKFEFLVKSQGGLNDTRKLRLILMI